MATKTAKVSPAVFEEVVRDLSTHVLVERDLELRVLIRGLLAGVNTHLLGPPGIAKSLTLRELTKRIDGAILFEKVIHPLLPAEAVIGQYDIAEFARTGDFHRKLEHYAPRAHFVFLDEITRGNGPMTDALLSMWNVGERAAEMNGGMGRTDIVAGVSASNHTFDPENAQAQAFADRMTLMVESEDIRTDDSFKTLIRRDHDRRVSASTGAYVPVTFTLAEFMAAQAEVMAVEPTPEFEQAAADLRTRARTEAQLYVSPRRWLEMYLVCRANAWMAGRDHLISEDLAICEHGLWRDPEDKRAAHKLVLDFHGRYEREATKYREELEPHLAKFQEFRPVVEGTPPDEQVEADTMQEAWQTQRAFKTIKQRVDRVIEEAKAESRDYAGLLEVQNDIVAVQEWYVKVGLSA